MQVLKFGGTSVGSVNAIRQIRDILEERVREDKLWVVVSAFGGTTDLLLKSGQLAAAGDDSYKEYLGQMEKRHLEAVRELMPLQVQSGLLSQVKTGCNEIEDICSGIFLLGEMTARSYDKLLSYGEWLSSVIIASSFKALGLDCEWKDSRELILTDSRFGQAAVDMQESFQRIQQFQQASSAKLVILPGFIARNAQGVTTTLGRGGSDYTAAILAAAAGASLLDIWTDVSGMMTADPRWVPNARIIPSISYQEAMELSHFGAKVIYPPTIQPVLARQIPIRIKNTFAPSDPGTLISNNPEKNGNMIRGISSINNIALLSLEGSGMIGVPGFAKRLFESLSSAGINVILITQGSSEHSICVGVEAQHAEAARKAVDEAFAAEIAFKKVEPLVVEKDLSIVALVGEQMKSHTGVSGKMFGVMGRNGVNVRAIAQGSSEKNISAVVATADVRKAINVLHEEFFEKVNKQVNLFICGVGNVGSKLLMQLDQQKQFLSEQLRLQVRIVGLANSKQFVLSEEGVDPGNWKNELDKGEKGDVQAFISSIISRNLRNSVFVDVTASEQVAGTYQRLLEKSISVVACNKIACSAAYANYKKLKDLAREYNASFLFETNVGAGLPVIGTLNDLMRSGDKVNHMEAVLSGTLNFVFNNYDGSRPFANVVRQAQEEGYTEPDPRLDLGGTDVMRKIMILARESGQVLEMDQIANRSFMPASCMVGTVEDFYREMEKEEDHFRKLYEEASSQGKKLKFVARYENGKASVGLQPIDSKHDFFHLYGKDNVVLFYTDRYRDQPMVIKGAGAGAEVTASGVFADIMRAARL